MSGDLADFLLARFGEDEQVARAVEAQAPRAVVARTALVDLLNGAEFMHSSAIAFPTARVLAECEAKRQIVELHVPQVIGTVATMDDSQFTPDGQLRTADAREWRDVEPDSFEDITSREVLCTACANYPPAPCPTLRLLALPYADHPDYRPEWRP